MTESTGEQIDQSIERITNQVHASVRRRDLTRRLAIAVALAAFATALALAVVGLFSALDDSRSRNAHLATQNTQLAAQLAELEQRSGDADARSTCRVNLSNDITEVGALVQLAIVDGLLAFAIDDEVELARVVGAAQNYRNRYEAAIEAKVAYEMAGAPLPCPINNK